MRSRSKIGLTVKQEPNRETSLDLPTIEQELAKIEPGVLSATEDELIAAGYGDTPRRHIPGNWRDVRANARPAQNQTGMKRAPTKRA